MSEVDEIKKLVTSQRITVEEAIKKITLAIETVDRNRKEKRDKSNRPN